MGGGGRPGAPKPSREERELIAEQLKQMRELYGIGMELLPYQLEQQRFERDERTGEITRIGYEDWLTRLDPDQRAAALSYTEAQNKTLRALKGELTDPVVENQIASQQAELNATLISSGITPGSTAYNNAMKEFNLGATSQRYGVNAGNIQLASMVSQRGGGYGVPGGGGGGVGPQPSDFSGPLGTLTGFRNQRDAYDWQVYQDRTSAVAGGATTGATIGAGAGGWGALIGGLVGAGYGYYASQ